MFPHIRRQGLHIQTLNTVMMAVTVAMCCLIIYTNIRLDNRYNDLLTAEELYNCSVADAQMLQAGSDNLTRQVQLLAETGEREYLDAYFAEVASGRREQAVDHLPANEDERVILNQAKYESDQLMYLEYHIMCLVATANGFEQEGLPPEVRDYALSRTELALEPEAMMEQACVLAFGHEYQSMKASIDQNIASFTELILSREQESFRYYSAQVNRHIAVQQTLMVVLIVCILITGLMLYTQVILVLERFSSALVKGLPLEKRGVYELRYLADVYNRLRDKNRDTEEMLAKKASLDSLTGVCNRGAFEVLVQQRLDSIPCAGGALMMLDVDKFKQVNDVHGHAAGDGVLINLAKLLPESFRGSDLIGRLGGDEFGVWLNGLSPENLSYIQQRIVGVNQRLLCPSEGLPPHHHQRGSGLLSGGRPLPLPFPSSGRGPVSGQGRRRRGLFAGKPLNMRL